MTDSLGFIIADILDIDIDDPNRIFSPLSSEYQLRKRMSAGKEYCPSGR